MGHHHWNRRLGIWWQIPPPKKIIRQKHGGGLEGLHKRDVLAQSHAQWDITDSDSVNIWVLLLFAQSVASCSRLFLKFLSLNFFDKVPCSLSKNEFDIRTKNRLPGMQNTPSDRIPCWNQVMFANPQKSHPKNLRWPTKWFQSRVLLKRKSIKTTLILMKPKAQYTSSSSTFVFWSDFLFTTPSPFSPRLPSAIAAMNRNHPCRPTAYRPHESWVDPVPFGQGRLLQSSYGGWAGGETIWIYGRKHNQW